VLLTTLKVATAPYSVTILGVGIAFLFFKGAVTIPVAVIHPIGVLLH